MSINRENQHEFWMRQALQQAELAASVGEVPVGAVLVDANNQLLAAGHNSPIIKHDPTAHAEIVVLREAAQRLGNYRLVDTALYVTLEPCVMCVGAMIHARVNRLVYGATEHKTGAIESRVNLLEQALFNHQIDVQAGVLATPCADILSDFFRRRRAQKKSQSTSGGENES